jgi:hypothetical protein
MASLLVTLRATLSSATLQRSRKRFKRHDFICTDAVSKPWRRRSEGSAMADREREAQRVRSGERHRKREGEGETESSFSCGFTKVLYIHHKPHPFQVFLMQS